ncbi:MAG: 16S rRNA (cytosine(1402)-N(4))-methyltransferase RsmH [Fusobacteria bacterium]|nr:16S rRNA (cytosine(1402)-N(4))-methyltransferase RsmH [Fusobacteriota bacterium]
MTSNTNYHIPVLTTEVLEALNINPEGIYVDCTLGGGGHSSQIVQKLTTGKLICIDQDKDAIKFAKERLKEYHDKIIFTNDNFAHLEKILYLNGFSKVDGILIDLGVSSYQLDTLERGFSYRMDAELDMRMNQSSGVGARWYVNNLTKEELAKIFFAYGEEKKSNRIASFIVAARQEKEIVTTFDLVEVIKRAVPYHQNKHPAKRVFQALRMHVNDELGVIKTVIEKSIQYLAPKGRLAIITFHSLEDRLVKTEFKYYNMECVCPPALPVCMCDKESLIHLITKKPIIPADHEVDENFRAHSSKLRVAERK